MSKLTKITHEQAADAIEAAEVVSQVDLGVAMIVECKSQVSGDFLVLTTIGNDCLMIQ